MVNNEIGKQMAAEHHIQNRSTSLSYVFLRKQTLLKEMSIAPILGTLAAAWRGITRDVGAKAVALYYEAVRG